MRGNGDEFQCIFSTNGASKLARGREREKERGREADADFGDAGGCGRDTHGSGAL